MYQLGITDEDLMNLVKDSVPSTSNKLSPMDPLVDVLPIPDNIKKQATSKTVAKSIDVLLLGPALIYSGAGKKLPKALGTLLILTGMGTILVNVGSLLDQADSWWSK